jgi:hypothetical protein
MFIMPFYSGKACTKTTLTTLCRVGNSQQFFAELPCVLLLAMTRWAYVSNQLPVQLNKGLILSAGGSAGIGKASAIAFSNNGAIVTITGRRQDRLDAVLKELKQVPAIHLIFPCTMTISILRSAVKGSQIKS